MFISVRDQPNSSSSGPTNIPKPYWEPPEANAVVKKDAQTIAQPREIV
jgi:hypothetical protein